LLSSAFSILLIHTFSMYERLGCTRDVFTYNFSSIFTRLVECKRATRIYRVFRVYGLIVGLFVQHWSSMPEARGGVSIGLQWQNANRPRSSYRAIA